MIRYLIDTSALWRVMREEKCRHAWSSVIDAGAIGSCGPQRAEFRRSARDLDHYEQIDDMFSVLYPDAPVPKSAWQWIESTQYRLLRKGVLRCASALDLLISATAAHHGLTVLHDDNDFGAIARCVSDLKERSIYDLP
ncbi:PIN domain-containing protein [Streptomonospora litoralis]|uniref:Ribonuclease VapC n=1 Tax=Streptomonospora litoralis TaxID=2498135 RepID=A0A4V0ZJX7_9ACTN|nr:PIN domain-containing protein [Streptomonospora litoralis]QBI55022.1 Ribonuclease VapC21 [Streptomonospora litoralis]